MESLKTQRAVEQKSLPIHDASDVCEALMSRKRGIPISLHQLVRDSHLKQGNIGWNFCSACDQSGTIFKGHNNSLIIPISPANDERLSRHMPMSWSPASRLALPFLHTSSLSSTRTNPVPPFSGGVL